MPSSHKIVFCAIDDLIPLTGSPLTGFPGFLDGLAEAGIPSVWVSSRNRHQLDSAIRKLGHSGPFIAEGGSGVFLPEDYFHLKPAHTVRLGRFTCIPVAAAQPASAEALETVSEETGIAVVPLRSLSPRELTQNTGLHRQEADALRQRDFDELFFFAGTSDADIDKFRQRAAHHKFLLRPVGPLWSLSVSANMGTCVQELRKLFDRALHTRALAVAIAAAGESADLGKACDRLVLLTDRAAAEAQTSAPAARRNPVKALPLFSPDTWEAALEAVQQRKT